MTRQLSFWFGALALCILLLIVPFANAIGQEVDPATAEYTQYLPGIFRNNQGVATPTPTATFISTAPPGTPTLTGFETPTPTTKTATPSPTISANAHHHRDRVCHRGAKTDKYSDGDPRSDEYTFGHPDRNSHGNSHNDCHRWSIANSDQYFRCLSGVDLFLCN